MNIPGERVIQLARAYHFAASRHVSQRRKGAAAEPYMNHLTEVAELVAEASAGDITLMTAAVLHDSVEDTEATLEELEALFGSEVAALVAEVTDDKALPKQMRKELQIEHAAQASARAKIIKLADKVSNLRSLANSPPADWEQQRIRDYFLWAARVVDGCRSASDLLAARFDAEFQRGMGLHGSRG